MSDFIMTCPWCDGVVEITNVLHNPGKRTIILTTKCAGCGTIVKFKHQYNKLLNNQLLKKRKKLLNNQLLN